MNKREAAIGVLGVVLGIGGSVLYVKNNQNPIPLPSAPAITDSYTLTLTNSDGSVAGTFNFPQGQTNTTYSYTSAVPAVVSAPSSNAIPLTTPYSGFSLTNIATLEDL